MAQGVPREELEALSALLNEVYEVGRAGLSAPRSSTRMHSVNADAFSIVLQAAFCCSPT